MIQISEEGLAALLSSAFKEGWQQGHDLLPEPDPAITFLEYQKAVEYMCADTVRH